MLQSDRECREGAMSWAYTREVPRRPREVELETWEKKGSDKGVKSQVTKHLVRGSKVFLISFFEKESL